MHVLNWNGQALTRENWEVVLQLSDFELEFIEIYCENKFYLGKRDKEVRETVIAAILTRREGLSTTKNNQNASYRRLLNKPNVSKGIEVCRYFLREEVSSKKTAILNAIANRALFDLSEYIDNNGRFLPGKGISDLPKFVIDSFKPVRGCDGKMHVEWKIADRSKAIDQYVNLFLGGNKSQVDLNIGEMKNLSIKEKREKLLEYQKRLAEIKNNKKIDE